MSESKVHNPELVALALVLCYTVSGCRVKQGEVSAMGKSLIEINEKINSLGATESRVYPEAVVEYFKYYGLDFENDFEGLEHIFGEFESGDNMLIGHIYEPAEYKATVIIAHGYFDHCGQLNHLIRHLLSGGFAVAAFDLPGHGLSGGERAAVDDFVQYRRALVDFADKVRDRLDGPFHFVGHSTGGSAMIDYLLTGKESIFDKVILAAPLVHCAGWELSKFSSQGKFMFVKQVSRVFRKNSSDKAFLDFIKNEDPLQSKQLPLKWVGALHSWNEKIYGLDSCDRQLMVLQGTADSTVDWRYNMKFLRAKFSAVEINMVKGARHELFNESASMREDVFFQITHYLEAK
ncbi:MAG: alpha/beta hydrolase [Planctomycetes bacterium]|nr:alpha/beta hydrolase [Planctomycetota bacterium]